MADWKDSLELARRQLALQEQKGEEDLLERLFRGLRSRGDTGVKYLVVHKHPDADAWLCLWIAHKFIPETRDAQIMFVNSGETLNGHEPNDPSVLHFDTGGGEYDQHGRGLERSSSAFLLAVRKGLEQDPGLRPLLELSIAVDNIDPIPPTNIHFTIEGYAFLLRLKDGSTDWDKVKERVFELFDIVYGQETQRVQSRLRFTQHATQRVLPNGLRIAAILGNPQLREAAFEHGDAVAVWTDARILHIPSDQVYAWSEFNRIKKSGSWGTFHEEDWERVFYTGIQRNRRFPNLFLDRVAEELTFAEARKRRVHPYDLPDVWFIHDSRAIILNGSRTHELRGKEFTILTPWEITDIVEKTLSRIPRDIVSRLEQKT